MRSSLGEINKLPTLETAQPATKDLIAREQPDLTDRSTLSAGVTVIGNHTNDARFSHRGARVSLGLAHSFRNGIRIDAGGFAERLWYEDEFAPFGMPRDDFGRGVSMGVQNNRLTILGAAPRVGCSASRWSSNIIFYDNRDVLECNLSLTHRF